ncbi:MAG: hypothetical protein ACTSRZ_18605 [Promethearchaeota archaeon]
MGVFNMVEEDNNQDKQTKKEDDEDINPELQKIRMRKLQRLIQMKKEAEKKKEQMLSLNQKIELVLKVLMQPDAYAYYKSIKERDEKLYQNITSALLPPQIINQLDLLISYLYRGMLRRSIISLIDIQYLERQILGIGPQITIKKRNQEAKSLSSFLREEE